VTKTPPFPPRLADDLFSSGELPLVTFLSKIAILVNQKILYSVLLLEHGAERSNPPDQIIDLYLGEVSGQLKSRGRMG